MYNQIIIYIKKYIVMTSSYNFLSFHCEHVMSCNCKSLIDIDKKYKEYQIKIEFGILSLSILFFKKDQIQFR